MPALVSQMPSTRRSRRWTARAWNFRAISSRSRGSSGRARRGRWRGGRRPRPSLVGRGRAVVGQVGEQRARVRLRRRSSSSAALRAIPNSQARCVPRRGVEAAPGAGRRARRPAAVTSSAAASVAQQRQHVGEDVARALAIQRIELGRSTVRRWRCSMTDPTPTLRPTADPSHAGTLRVRHRAVAVAIAVAAVLAAPPRAAPPTATPTSRSPRCCGRRSTCATRPSTRTRSASAPRCPGSAQKGEQHVHALPGAVLHARRTTSWATRRRGGDSGFQSVGSAKSARESGLELPRSRRRRASRTYRCAASRVLRVAREGPGRRAQRAQARRARATARAPAPTRRATQRRQCTITA